MTTAYWNNITPTGVEELSFNPEPPSSEGYEWRKLLLTIVSSVLQAHLTMINSVIHFITILLYPQPLEALWPPSSRYYEIEWSTLRSHEFWFWSIVQSMIFIYIFKYIAI